jgi:NTE family protein
MRSLRGLLGRHRPARTAFVLSGGGNMGALQVGMLRALLERHIRPDLVLGCSVGALNGAAIAAEPTLATVGRLEEVWVDLEHRKLLPAGILPATVQLARRGVALHSNGGLRVLVEDVLGGRDFPDLAVPFQCVATDIDRAREVWFSDGPLVEPILASAALPAVLPPVVIDGVRYMDGAVLNDVPVTRAVALGATHVYVLHTGTFDRPRPEPRRPLDLALQAYWIARRARFQRDLAALPPHVEVTILPTGEAPVVRFNDLSQSRALIDVAYRASARALSQPPSPADGRAPERSRGAVRANESFGPSRNGGRDPIH